MTAVTFALRRSMERRRNMPMACIVFPTTVRFASAGTLVSGG